MTRKDMGIVLGVADHTVYYYEAGKIRIPCKHLKQINRLLSAPIPPATHATLSGEELRFLRTSRGLSQKQVAKAFGISHTSISAYECGRLPIPAGLPDCIKGMAPPKGNLLLPDEPIAPYSLNDLLQLIAQSRAEERKHWLRLGDAISPIELRQFRQSRGLSQTKLAQQLGISKTTQHKYVNGHIRMPIGYAQKIINLFPYRTITPTELLQLRNSANLSQSYIDRALHFDSNAIHHYEAGIRKISYELSVRLMGFFQQMAEDTRSNVKTVK